jgi:hypothetical protein
MLAGSAADDTGGHELETPAEVAVAEGAGVFGLEGLFQRAQALGVDAPVVEGDRDLGRLSLVADVCLGGDLDLGGVDALGGQPGLDVLAQLRERRGDVRGVLSTERAPCCSISAASKPKALKTPGEGGISTLVTPISRAIPAACRGPDPPKAISAKSAGSRPRSTETVLTVRTMLEFATRWMPQAAASRDIPQGAHT